MNESGAGRAIGPLLPVGRAAAVAVSVSTFVALFVRDNVRMDNPFFIPDVALCAILATGAVLPRRAAIAVLMVGFAFAAGVITTAVFDYVARDDLVAGLPTAAVALVCAILAALLVARVSRAVP